MAAARFAREPGRRWQVVLVLQGETDGKLRRALRKRVGDPERLSRNSDPGFPLWAHQTPWLSLHSSSRFLIRPRAVKFWEPGDL